jgi:transposase
MKPLVTDALWQRLEPLLPPPPQRRFRFPGRKPLDYRKVLTGILFVLKTGINWEDLPCELGCGCGMTCWRRLRDWNRAGVWQRLHEVLLAELEGADRIDWERAVIDSSFVRARGGGGRTGPSPVDRRKVGSKHTIITDAGGLPLAATTTAANVPDVVPLIPLVDAIPPVRGKRGRPRRRPRRLYGDRGFDSEENRRQLRRRGIRPVIARRWTGHGSGLGKVRWVVERTLSWLHGFGRLRVRKDRTPAIHQAFLTLGCAMICLNFLR